MNYSPRFPRSSTIRIAVLGFFGALLMSVGGLLVALQFQSQRFPTLSPWQMLKFLASITTGLQWAQVMGWEAIIGLLIALGVDASTVTRARAAAALAAGALVPVGLVLLGHQVNRIWPDTPGPTLRPAMMCFLTAYSLAVPWTLGRLIRRWVPVDRAPQTKPRAISQ